MSATTTSDAMLRTRFVCYLYSFSLPFFFFDDDDDGYTALQTNSRRMIFYLRHTREEPLICLYVCVLPCSDDDATEMKRVLRRGGTLQWDVREETRKKQREGKIYEEKHKHIYITLAPIIERFHSVLLTSHRCAWISMKEKREKNEKCRNGHVLLRYSFLSLSPSLLHLLSAIVGFLLYIHTCLIIVTSSSSSSMHIRYVLFLMGNLITCMIEQLEKEKEGKTHVK